MSEKKKLFPKLKKKISDFLADESGEITKKDALWIAAGATILAGVESVEAEIITKVSSDWKWWTTTIKIDVPSSHLSWVVNGHMSSRPYDNMSISHGSHGSHGSHWSHGSHGSHWSRW